MRPALRSALRARPNQAAASARSPVPRAKSAISSSSDTASAGAVDSSPARTSSMSFLKTYLQPALSRSSARIFSRARPCWCGWAARTRSGKGRRPSASGAGSGRPVANSPAGSHASSRISMSR
ncbi:hypothetical protein D8771_26715 [Streptomyces albus]|uniref:Uncharacterized protein n=1 Tax=Streptomyces albus TaxID=1888 RepID=A0A8H1L478_9ACTN|nr:hypothetical protein D8771_26715 [Streptomyces albus]